MVTALVNPMTTAIVLSVSSFPTNRMSMVSSTFSSNYGGTDFGKRYAALQFLFPHYNFKNFKIFHERFSNGLSSMVSSTFSSNYGGTDFSNRYAALQFLFPRYNFKNFKISHERFSNGLSSRRGFRVSCETKVIHAPF